jgi:ATP-dependent helicase Lhr and Lhr-like helicase
VDTEWVSRRLLARMHSYSRRTRRGGVEPATAQDFMRFLLRWQHVAPGTQLTGEAGLLTVVEQLQGFDAAAVAWEPDLIGSRLRRYDPAWLDRLCHDGEVAWLRMNPPARATDAPSVAPSKATPISVVARVDLPWLLAAARVGTDPGAPVVGGTAEILEVLQERGACFATELGTATNRLPEDIERALWDGVARGLVMSDGFGAIRARVEHGKRTTEGRRFSRLARAPRLARAAAGRWSLVPSTEVDLEELTGSDRDELAEAVAELLLHRWGVLFRDLVMHDSLRFPWRDLQWALRRLEDRGLVRGGRFVSGFSGEQYALPEAHEQLTQARKAPRTGERVTVNATDPLNLAGVIVPGPRVPAVRTNRVTYVDGVVEGTADTERARSA